MPFYGSKKSKRRMEYPSDFSSHAIHICNKIKTVKCKLNLSPHLLANLENDLNVFVTLYRTLIFNTLQDSIKSALKFLRRFRRNENIPSTVSYKNEIAYSDNAIAKLIQQTLRVSFEFLADVVILPSTISELLSNCIISLGIDTIPPIIYRDCAVVIAPLVCQIFNDVIESFIWPDVWTCLFITPIPKSENSVGVED